MSNLDIHLDSNYFVLMDDNNLSLGQAILLLTQQHNEQVASEVIRKYCLETPDEKNPRVGMEFLYINGYYTDLQYLIIKNKASLNILNQKWADLFQILLDLRYKRNKAHIYLQRLKEIKIGDA